MGNSKKTNCVKPIFTKNASSSLKGFAIIMVILSHYAEWWSWFYPTEGLSADIRMFCSLLGDYGVAIFFMVSGYGMVKSAGKNRIGWKFVSRRLQNVYIPYLAIALIIQLLAGTFDLINLLTGDDFWFMTVIFMLYIAFMFVWAAAKNPHIRVLLFTAACAGITQYLYLDGNQVFWYNAVFTFALGTILGTYEKWIAKAYRFISIPGAVLCSVGMFFVAKYGLRPELQNFAKPEEAIYCQTGCLLLFALLISFISYLWKYFDPVSGYLGQMSMYLYLTHTYIFMQTINHPGINGNFKLGFVLATIISLIVSAICYLIFNVLIPFLLKKFRA